MQTLADALTQFITAQTGAAAAVRDLQRIPGGFSYETWRFQARWQADGTHHDAALILRRAPLGGLLEPYDASREFRVLRALAGSAIPVPRVLWLDPTGAALERCAYVMEFVAGAIPLPSDTTIAPEERRALHEQFTDTLAALHRFDWEGQGIAFLGVPVDRDDPAALELDRADALLSRVALRPYPMLREVLAWLRAHRPRSPRLSLIHDDYRLGNVVWAAGRIVAVLDWERAFIGDPMADIAFTRLDNLAGWCSIDGPMAERYTAQSGIAVDEERVRFYIILEQLKATLVGLTGLRAFADGRTSDLRLLMIGRFAQEGIAGIVRAVGLDT